MVASSYQAEVCALREAWGWLSDHHSEWKSIVVVSDSQATLRALRDVRVDRVSVSLGRVVDLGWDLGDRGKRLVFVWVPGQGFSGERVSE